MNVSTYARGLLKLLGTSSDGSTPRDFSDQLVGIVDVAPFLASSLRANQRVVIAGMVNGDNGAMTVPAGEFWIVRAGGATISHAAAATATDIAIHMYPGEASLGLFVSETFQAVSAAAEVKSVPFLPVGIILTPGTILRVYSTTIVGAVTGELNLYVDVLR